MISDYAPLLVIGLATGSVYAIAAMGLVLTYKTSGIFNFGHGAVGCAAAYLFYELYVVHGLPWPVAAAIAIIVFGAVTGLIVELIARRLASAPLAMKVVGTVGLLLTVQGIAVLRYGQTQRSLPQFLPQRTFEIVGVFVGADQLIVAAVALSAAIGLYLFFRLTQTGTAMRAVVDDASLLELTGTSTVRVRRTAWVLGSMFAAVAGILIAPLLGLDATLLTLLVIQAFGAAAVGRFTNLPLTYVGGLLVGVLHEFVGKWVGSSTSLAALPTAVPFLLLFVVLLFTPKGKLPDFGQVVRAQVSRSWLRGRQARLGGVLLAALALTVPFFAGAKTILFTTALVYVGLLLSIGLLMRLSGMVSLCQVGFMGIGAAIFGRLEGGAGLPWPIALLLAALLTVPFGAVVAIPAIRLSGLYLTLATFGYGILVEQILYRQPWLFANSAGVHANRPPAFQSDSGYYYFVLGIAVVLSALVAALERARLGRLLRALGDSPRALAMHGTNINVLRLIVFCVASFLAAVSGALYVPLFGSVNGDSFPSFTSLVLLALLAICGRNVVLAAIVAGLAYVVAPGYLNSSTLVNALPMIFGVSAIVAALGGIRGRWKETPSWPLRRDWSGRVPSRSPAPVPLASRHAAPAYLTARSSLPTPSYSQRTARP